jgi:uncharacterized protein (DUF433 family)
MDSRDPITIDPDILGGVPVFKGTQMPIKTLFQYLENDYSLEEFLECFPSVTREAARRSWSALSRLCSPSRRMRILLDECVPWPTHKLHYRRPKSSLPTKPRWSPYRNP